MAPLSLLLAVLAVLSGVAAEYVEYDTSPRIVPGMINVHLVPHTHDDVGWLKTVDQYYVGSNNSIQGASVQNVLDSVVQALLSDKNRKFIYVEQAFFQRWWSQQSDAMKTIVKELVSSGQLEFINGGMCMHDEATTHYIDMIDQTTLGHRFIKKEFNKIPRIGWQIDPFGHSAVQAYLLSTEVGFDALYFFRIDYQDKQNRKELKNLETVWRGSKTFGSSSDIFTGIFPNSYEPPTGFHFEVNDDDPVVQDDINLFDYNVQERVNDFVETAVAQESSLGMRNGLRRERKLSGIFDREVFDILDGKEVEAPPAKEGVGGGPKEEGGGVLGGGGTAGREITVVEEEDEEEEKEEAAVFDSGRTTADDGLFSDSDEDDKEKDDIRSSPLPASSAVPVAVTPISERKFDPSFPSGSDQDRGKEKTERAGRTAAGRKRQRASGGSEETRGEKEKEKENILQDQLVEILDRNSRMMTEQLEAQNVNCRLDREQRTDMTRSVVEVLGKLAEAIGKIADKL